jgi:hypothetical protein
MASGVARAGCIGRSIREFDGASLQALLTLTDLHLHSLAFCQPVIEVEYSSGDEYSAGALPLVHLRNGSPVAEPDARVAPGVG